jgi:hypothetical protein
MGDLSQYYNKKGFICRCGTCKGEDFRIHLGLVGALELIGSNYKKTPKILSAFWCEDYNNQHNAGKKSYHTQGKAAHIQIEGIPANELFNYIESNVPEVSGIGFYPEGGFVHIDTRRKEKSAWVKERDRHTPLNAEKRKQYGLQDEKTG